MSIKYHSINENNPNGSISKDIELGHEILPIPYIENADLSNDADLSNLENSDTPQLQNNQKKKISQISNFSINSTNIKTSPNNLQSSDHQLIMNETISIIKKLIIIGVNSNFWYSARLYVWILYAQSFFGGSTINTSINNDDNNNRMNNHSINREIVVIWYCFFISKSFNSIFSSMISDYIGFDTIMTIQTFLISLGILFESLAQSFEVLAIGVLIVSLAGNVGVNIKGFIAIMLPNSEAIQYTGYTYAFMVITYLAGPVISGICAHYFGYRSCFYLSFIVASFSFIVLFTFVRKKQLYLTSKQLQFLEYYSTEKIPELEQFPQCLEYKRKKMKFILEQKQNKLNKLKMINNNECILIKLLKKFSNMIPKLNKIKLIELSCIIIQMAFVCGCESILGSWYTAYMHQRFGTSIKKSTLQIALSCVTAAFGNVLPSLFLKKYPIFKQHLEWIIIIAYLISILLGIFIVPHAKNENDYWLWTPLIVALLGFIVMSVESIFVTIIPKKDAGKLNGLLGGIMAFVAGTGTFIVGIMWDTDNGLHGWIWYACALFYGIGGIMMIIFKIIQKIAPNQSSYLK